jgi:hypothetical protein
MREWLLDRNRLAALGGLSALHAVVCWGLFRITVLNTLERAETGRLPTEFEANLQTTSDLLMYPFMQLSAGPKWFQLLNGVLPLIVTSLLWGAGLYLGYLGLVRLVRHIKGQRRARTIGS